jgi:S-adenosylmethionine synthetase
MTLSPFEKSFFIINKNGMKKFITVESVTNGHPDKICDQISDAILDAYLAQDPMSRVAVETFGGHGTLVIGGEVTSLGKVDPAEIASKVYKEVGYDEPLEIICKIVSQSPDIAQGVDTGGAGDQGIMYGYACDETPEYLPAPIVLVNKLAQGLKDCRETDPKYSGLRPDGKVQLTYLGDKLQTVLISTQHTPETSQADLRKLLVEDFLPRYIKDLNDVEVLINPTGKFELGGFTADTGLTGRKIMVDTYCGLIPHGGGAFSGKDATKVDRSAAYYCRYVAKSLVSAGLAKQCLVSVAYAIGKAEPLMVNVETENGPDEKLSELVKKNFDFRPQSIIKELDLRKPVFQKTAAFGHFGRAGFSWENVKKIEL